MPDNLKSPTIVLIKPAKSFHKYCDFSQIDNKVKSTSYLWQAALGFFFASFWLLRRKVTFWVFYHYYSQPVSWPDPWVPTWPGRSISLLSCNVTLVPRPIHPLQVLYFLLRTLVQKAKRKDLLSSAQRFQMHNTSSNAGCLTELFTLRASGGPVLSCVFPFLFVWSLPGSDLLLWPYWEAIL